MLSIWLPSCMSEISFRIWRIYIWLCAVFICAPSRFYLSLRCTYCTPTWRVTFKCDCEYIFVIICVVSCSECFSPQFLLLLLLHWAMTDENLHLFRDCAPLRNQSWSPISRLRAYQTNTDERIQILCSVQTSSSLSIFHFTFAFMVVVASGHNMHCFFFFVCLISRSLLFCVFSFLSAKYEKSVAAFLFTSNI